MGHARSRAERRISLSIAAALAAAVVAFAAAPPATAQPPGGPRILHLPMRWCVLEGAPAARRDPTAAVLERIRRGSSILAREAGITLQSPITRALGEHIGFPVIADPRPNVGRLGDVVVPIESTVEYRLVIERCEQAWRRIEQAVGPDADLRAVARGPASVIIRDFVTRSGALFPAVWGYGFSVSSAGDYCVAADPNVRSASGGTLMVVDSSDGQPSALLDRRLIAHEVGHILRLGHGNGLDDRGSVPGRIDKFCDDTENPDVEPGSLMSANLRYDRVTPWQRVLPRAVASRHPAVVADQPLLRVRPPRTPSDALERLANDGTRVVSRLLPPGRSALSPLDRLRSAGVLGAQVWDALRDAQGRDAGARADLQAMGLSEDDESGDVIVWVEPVGDPGGPGVDTVVDVIVDADADPATGGGSDDADDTDDADDGPFSHWPGLHGAELVAQIHVLDGEATGQAWHWDGITASWLEITPAPEARLAGGFGEDDDRSSARTIELALPAAALAVAEEFGMAGQLRTTMRDGRVQTDMLPEGAAAGEWAPMTLSVPDYPVCAVDRDAILPGTATPGGRATLEVHGFGADGPVSIWFADAQEPIATGEYWEVPDGTWPWVAELAIPVDAEPGMHMIQVALEGTGMTAQCPVLVGDAAVPDFDD